MPGREGEKIKEERLVGQLMARLDHAHGGFEVVLSRLTLKCFCPFDL
jgi:hypothetical protein